MSGITVAGCPPACLAGPSAIAHTDRTRVVPVRTAGRTLAVLARAHLARRNILPISDHRDRAAKMLLQRLNL